jgi:hypothetical protein
MDKKEPKKDPRKPHPPFGHLLKRRREMDTIYLAAFSGGHFDVAFVLL